jgi:hypothetical protein
MAGAELAPWESNAQNREEFDPKAVDIGPWPDGLQRRLAQLEALELACLDDPEKDPRCIGPTVAGLKKIVVYYEEAILGACLNPTVVLHLRKELQTYVALLRTVERFETLDLRRAENQRSKKGTGKSSGDSRVQFLP